MTQDVVLAPGTVTAYGPVVVETDYGVFVATVSGVVLIPKSSVALRAEAEGFGRALPTTRRVTHTHAPRANVVDFRLAA